MRKTFAALALASLVTGCSTVSASVAQCPAVVPYSSAFLLQVQAETDEMASFSEFPATRQMIRDYGGERDRLRACVPPKKS